MDKYKDFKELADKSEQSLRTLFCMRCYEPRINSPHADDIILYENMEDAFERLPDNYVRGKKGGTKILTPEEIAELKKSKASVALQFPEGIEEEFAAWELRYLNPLEVEDYYIRKRVESYLNLCREIIKENKEKKTKGISVTLARAVCICMLHDKDKVSFMNSNGTWKKGRIIDFISEHWTPKWKSIYKHIPNLSLSKIERDKPKEYEHGLELFKELS